MSQAMENARLESDGFKQYILALYYLLTMSFSITIAVVGLGFVAFGAFVLPGIHDVMAGMFGVWGISLILFGVLVYVFLWLNQLYARVTTDEGDEEEESGADTDLSL